MRNCVGMSLRGARFTSMVKILKIYGQSAAKFQKFWNTVQRLDGDRLNSLRYSPIFNRNIEASRIKWPLDFLYSKCTLCNGNSKNLFLLYLINGIIKLK